MTRMTRLFALVPLVTLLAATSTYKEGANDVTTTKLDYTDVSGCHIHEENVRTTTGGTFVKNARSVEKTCGSHTYTFKSTLTATGKARSHKDEQSLDNDPSTCSRLARIESGDYEKNEEVSGTRTIEQTIDGIAQPASKAIIKNGTWVTIGRQTARGATSTCPVAPIPGEDGGYQTNAMLPPFAGANSTIVVTVTPGEGGAQGVLVLTEDDQHNKTYQRKKPDPLGRLLIDVTIGTVAIDLVKRIDEHGVPDILSQTSVANPAHIPGTDLVANPSQSGPSILESTSSAQPGDVIVAHVARVDPRTTQFSIDGHAVAPMSVSNNSALVRIPPDTSLAFHSFTISSGGKNGRPLSIAIVRLTPEPVAPSSPGVVQPVRIHVEGLAPGVRATMHFQVGGAATMLDGGGEATVPVTNGIATVQICGTRSGEALLRFHLVVVNPQFKP